MPGFLEAAAHSSNFFLASSNVMSFGFLPIPASPFKIAPRCTWASSSATDRLMLLPSRFWWRVPLILQSRYQVFPRR